MSYVFCVRAEMGDASFSPAVACSVGLAATTRRRERTRKRKKEKKGEKGATTDFRRRTALLTGCLNEEYNLQRHQLLLPQILRDSAVKALQHRHHHHLGVFCLTHFFLGIDR